MTDFTINANNDLSDFSIGINTPSPAAAPIPQPEQPKQPSIYGKVPQIPVLDAVEGIKFDFNEGIRILFPHNGKEYHVTFLDIDTGVILYSADTVPGAVYRQGKSSRNRIELELYSLRSRRFYRRFALAGAH